MPQSDAPITRQDLDDLKCEIVETLTRHLRAELARALDPLALSLATAPGTDEPETPEERAAVQAAVADNSPRIPHDKVLKDFGLLRPSSGTPTPAPN